MIKKHTNVIYEGERYFVKSVGKVYATIYSFSKPPHEAFRVKLSELEELILEDVSKC